MSIEVTHISKAYGSQKALNDVSFSLKKGEVVGFLGPNGAGKSTMMKILTTYIAANGGQARVNGFDVATQKKDVQKSIGYLPEHNPLYLDMYVKEYLGFSASIYGSAGKKTGKERIKEVIDLTGLSPEAHKKIGQLSKGYRQRTGLAAAMLHDPEVLILDEPTTGLDPNQLIEIRSLIRDMGQEKTVLLSTHIMQEVEAICDRVIIINKGEIVADKKLASLREGTEQIIEVEFDYRVEPLLLENLPQVQSVNNIYDFVYELRFNTTKDMRPAVFDFAHDNGLKTLKLNKKNKNLESLFRELTGNKP
ncbi:gliding motility-associated ABC transporter ATP-binding subunit GldA [Sinomicrobium weinanense]|uniref:Gliding motility-associated ABC transporter ATP-binding subunit GldA n=1 Tax=Sinomicrobium weinanense TaxID=2842200 RepID=A0A926JRT7_9FLAO|nr:gliding motility-associated ABC transporter ATP-binding subunit GldA [Sinomicrobium weinanense]MBC9796189.1 gliding motility-associated ABC transporter ATP-binding subunit GldA [Sinomicrobium weinanense]MBU3123468.1 gliding motility-associated ABC transporter ATP-binding subunit GldA [Sinomicrobium weinanense]